MNVRQCEQVFPGQERGASICNRVARGPPQQAKGLEGEGPSADVRRISPKGNSIAFCPGGRFLPFREICGGYVVQLGVGVMGTNVVQLGVGVMGTNVVQLGVGVMGINVVQLGGMYIFVQQSYLQFLLRMRIYSKLMFLL